jgi:hypothetical protein
LPFWLFLTGINHTGENCYNDTGDKLFTGVNDTGDKLFTGVSDTDDKLF